MYRGAIGAITSNYIDGRKHAWVTSKKVFAFLTAYFSFYGFLSIQSRLSNPLLAAKNLVFMLKTERRREFSPSAYNRQKNFQLAACNILGLYYLTSS